MGNKYINFENGKVIAGPTDLPEVFQLPTGETITGFNLLENNDPQKLIDLHWYLVNDPVVEFDSDYEAVVYSSWFIEENTCKRNYVKLFRDFSYALTIAFNKLDVNRELYETGGFEYDYYGIGVKILTDKEFSQGKLNSAYSKAKESVSIDNAILDAQEKIEKYSNTSGLEIFIEEQQSILNKLSLLDKPRLDTDVWKFINSTDGSTIVVQLSNLDLLKVCDFVYRKIQDSYNLTSQIAWQMLGCENTETLVNNIINGTINLNPWANAGIPWEY